MPLDGDGHSGSTSNPAPQAFPNALTIAKYAKQSRRRKKEARPPPQPSPWRRGHRRIVARRRFKNRAQARAIAIAIPTGGASSAAPILHPMQARQRGFPDIGVAGLRVAHVFCAHTPASGQSLSATHGGPAAWASSFCVSAQDLGGASPGKWGASGASAPLIATECGLAGVPPKATRLSYLLNAMVK